MGVKVLKYDAERVFDVLCHMQAHRGETYTKFKTPLDVNQQASFVTRAIQAFMHGVADIESGGLVSIQAFSGSSDLPTLTKDVFDVTAKVDNFDLAWQEAFKTIPLRKGQLSWEIADVANAVVFRKIPEGGKVEFGKVSGDKVTAEIAKYGAGLAFTWEMIEGNKLYAFVELMDTTRAKLYGTWGSVHYGLINTAAAAHTTAWQGISTDKQIDRDIMTLNAAAYSIANACKDKGYGDTANMPMILYVNPKYRSRITAAFKASQQDVIASGGRGVTIDWPIEVRYTFSRAITADKGNLVIPGHKFQNAVYLRELGLKRQDQDTLSELQTYWTAFGAAAADSEQASQISFA